MLQSFREIVRNDNSLLQLLAVDDNSSKVKDGAIKISDINGICAKITSTIDTLDPKCYSRRTAWILAARLLIGLTVHYTFQVQICLDESRRLKESCCRQSFVFERTKTTKRKIKASQTTHTKNKKKRTVEFEVEETVSTVELVRFWEEPLQLEKNLQFSQDLNIVPADQVTLREFDEPSLDTIDDEADFSFGDEGQCFQFDEDEEMEPIPRVQHASITLDENMNDIVAPEIDLEMTSLETELPAPHATVGNANVTKDNMETLKSLSPMQPPIVPPKTNKKKRRSTLSIDTDKTIPSKVMQRRISNVLVECRKPPSAVVQAKQRVSLLKTNILEMFPVLLMNGSIELNKFAKHATLKQKETDWSITQATTAHINRDDSNAEIHDASNEVIDILRNENESQIRTRSQSRNSFNMPAPAEPSKTSTPRQPPSRLSFRCSTPQSNDPLIDMDTNAGNGIFDFLDDMIVPSSSNIVRHSGSMPTSAPVSPPIGFGRKLQSESELPNAPVRRSQPRIQNSVPEIDQNDHQLVECPNLIGLLGENSLEYTVMGKLMYLWQKSVHPIKVENLLTPRSNRFEAAKTFSSLLTLKKKELVQLENSDDGKITHISQGVDLNLVGTV